VTAEDVDKDDTTVNALLPLGAQRCDGSHHQARLSANLIFSIKNQAQYVLSINVKFFAPVPAFALG